MPSAKLAILLVLALAMFSFGLSAQNSNTNIELRIAAINAVHPPRQSKHLVVVARSIEEMSVAAETSVRLGAVTRACYLKVCNDIVGRDTTAVNVEILQLTDMGAVVLVNSWVRMPTRREGDQTFGNVYKVHLKKIGNAWKVVSVALKFES